MTAKWFRVFRILHHESINDVDSGVREKGGDTQTQDSHYQPVEAR